MTDEVQFQAQIKGLTAQLDATKQMLNESLANQLQLRSSLIIMQQSNQEFCKEIANLKGDKEKLLAQVTELDAKVSALTTPEVTQDAANQISE